MYTCAHVSMYMYMQGSGCFYNVIHNNTNKEAYFVMITIIPISSGVEIGIFLDIDNIIESVNSSTSTPSQSTTSSLSSGDVHIINLRHVSDLSITPQPQQNGVTTDPSALPRINLAKVDQRIKKNLADRRREINSRGVNVSEEAQQLFDSLRKV